ncbi:hypothetical protein [Streptomyces sp. NPDC047725]|uniref:hypothetical protein n=2 Tax=unclassified Streptomyces TaxID=2593676 RepID=UPI00371198B1
MMHSSAQTEFLASANRANDRETQTCEDAVFQYAGERTLEPVPEGAEIPIYGEVTYANNMWAGLSKCHETEDGFDTNAASLEWKKEANGWIISGVDIWLGCGG